MKIAVSLGAGHGGHDYGAVSPFGAAEKYITLPLCAQIKQRLDRTGAIETFMVRISDEYISTEKRIDTACRWASQCHVEIHFANAFRGFECTRVLYANLSDEPHAARLSQNISEISDCCNFTILKQDDFSKFFKPAFEDYFSIVPMLYTSGIEHVFFIECPMPSYESMNLLLDMTAEAIADAVCGLFGISRIKTAARQNDNAKIKPVQDVIFLNSGFYNVRAGPGDVFDVVKTISGLIYSESYGCEDGWFRIGDGEYVTASAVKEKFKVPYLADKCFKAEPSVIKKGLFYIRLKNSCSSEVIGIAESGQIFPTIKSGNLRMVPLGERTGYIADDAFEKQT